MHQKKACLFHLLQLLHISQLRYPASIQLFGEDFSEKRIMAAEFALRLEPSSSCVYQQ